MIQRVSFQLGYIYLHKIKIKLGIYSTYIHFIQVKLTQLEYFRVFTLLYHVIFLYYASFQNQVIYFYAQLKKRKSICIILRIFFTTNIDPFPLNFRCFTLIINKLFSCSKVHLFIQRVFKTMVPLPRTFFFSFSLIRMKAYKETIKRFTKYFICILRYLIFRECYGCPTLSFPEEDRVYTKYFKAIFLHCS